MKGAIKSSNFLGTLASLTKSRPIKISFYERVMETLDFFPYSALYKTCLVAFQVEFHFPELVFFNLLGEKKKKEKPNSSPYSEL